MRDEGQSGERGRAPAVFNKVLSKRMAAPLSVLRITAGRYPEIRVREPVLNKQRTKPQHAPPDDMGYEETLARWHYWRLQTPEENAVNARPRWQFLTPNMVVSGLRRPYLIVLERHEDGALEFVTAHWRRPEWVRGWRERNQTGNVVNEREGNG